MLDKFTAHPHAVGETYAEHAHTAASFGLEMIGAGLACLVHALIGLGELGAVIPEHMGGFAAEILADEHQGALMLGGVHAVHAEDHL